MFTGKVSVLREIQPAFFVAFIAGELLPGIVGLFAG